MKSTESIPRTSDYLTPKFWPIWFGLGLLRLLALLPYQVQMRLGILIGWLGYHLMRRRRHIAAVNISMCFPELSPAEQKQLLRKTFRSIGISISETALSWWGSERRLRKLGHITGIENIQKALEKKKGVILLSAHMTCLEIGGRLLSFQQPFQLVYKKAKNPLFELFMQRARTRHYVRAIETYELKNLLKGLKENLVTWYAADQDFGRKQSVFAPFMGVSTTTLTTPARLAKMSGAAVVPYFPRRLDNGKGYELTILPELENFPSGDDIEDASRINSIIEQAIRQAPDQYFWVHRRFKTQPDIETDVYS